MILRKPYKFLIKHFKFIHLLLFVPVVYLIVRTTRIFSFFSSYISNRYTYESISNLAGSYVNIFMYLAALTIIGISVTVFYLMKQKEKPTKLYIAYIVYYIIIFVAITFFHSILSEMERNDLAASASRAYRDISLLVILPQYFFAFYSIFRGLGFDIRKFSFEKDLKDLDISEEDNEEFEFVLGVETYKYKRTVRRFIREFKYYVLENKFVFTVLSVVACLIVATTLYLHFNVYNKSYTKNHSFSHDAFNITVTDSMLTTMDYNGKVLKPGKYYLVLQMRIVNNSIVDVDLDTPNFRLQTKDGYVIPTLDRSEYFKDFGASYNGEKIISGTDRIYNLVYELDKKDIKRNYKIKILEKVEYNVGDITAHYKIINIRPTRVYENDKTVEYDVNKEIDLSDSNIGDAKVTIKNYELTETYYYKYKKCIDNNCRELQDVVTSGSNNKSKTILLILEEDTTLDENSIYVGGDMKKKNFYEDFFTVEYDGTELLTKNMTPDNMKGKVALQVSDKILDAKKLNLVITIRDKKYKVVLKK